MPRHLTAYRPLACSRSLPRPICLQADPLSGSGRESALTDMRQDLCAVFNVFLAIAGIGLTATVPTAPAQVSVNIGVAPNCPYGYFDYAPYSCSPYGYYGPDFNGGLFIGVGPWFHGGRGFYGHVDNRYDPRRGYNGPVPARGEQSFNLNSAVRPSR